VVPIYDLVSTFLLDEFAFKSHSSAQNGLLMKLRVNRYDRACNTREHIGFRRELCCCIACLPRARSETQT
jgi:hypothetical protein